MLHSNSRLFLVMEFAGSASGENCSRKVRYSNTGHIRRYQYFGVRTLCIYMARNPKSFVDGVGWSWHTHCQTCSGFDRVTYQMEAQILKSQMLLRCRCWADLDILDVSSTNLQCICGTFWNQVKILSICFEACKLAIAGALRAGSKNIFVRNRSKKCFERGIFLGIFTRKSWKPVRLCSPTAIMFWLCPVSPFMSQRLNQVSIHRWIQPCEADSVVHYWGRTQQRMNESEVNNCAMNAFGGSIFACPEKWVWYESTRTSLTAQILY